jgi:hypothetical protein
MSVELLETPRFYGFRVRRQIAGRSYQEYFSLKQGGRRLRGDARAEVEARAEARDAALARQQRAHRRKLARSVHIAGKGRVRGILCRLKAEKSGNMTPVFQVGIMSLREKRVVNTTVSINRHGLTEAWRRAVDFYAHHKQIDRRSAAYRSLLGARPPRAQLAALREQTV